MSRAPGLANRRGRGDQSLSGTPEPGGAITAAHARLSWRTPAGDVLAQRNPAAAASGPLTTAQRAAAALAVLRETWQPEGARRQPCDPLYGCGQPDAWHGFAAALSASGAVSVHIVCAGCGYSRPADGVRVPAVWKAAPPPPIQDNSAANPDCERCGTQGTELHHYAPRDRFPDPERWAMGYLCRGCHRVWHATMTPRGRVTA